MSNSKIIEDAIAWCLSIANDNTHGYDQTKRWGPDYDCSSFVIQGFENAGCPVKTNGASYTGNMLGVFKATGFEQLNFTTGMTLVRGDVLWRSGHTELYIGNNQNVGAHINEKGTITGGVTGDQTGNEISVSKTGTNWTYVLRLPLGDGETLPDVDPYPDENEEYVGGDDTPIKFPKRKKYKFLLFKKKRWIV